MIPVGKWSKTGLVAFFVLVKSAFARTIALWVPDIYSVKSKKWTDLSIYRVFFTHLTLK